MMCLVKRKVNGPKLEIRLFSASRNRVSQHDSSSLEFISNVTSTSSSQEHHSRESRRSSSHEHHSRESRHSNVSTASLASLREVVGDGATIFSFKELSKATENFSPARRIGQSVFRGTVKGTMDVAIVIQRKGDGFKDLAAELKKLCSVHHRNVVKMVGACASEGMDHLYIVYEYIEGGANLRECLRSSHAPGFCVLSTWLLRVQAALDVAKGLEYLHEHTQSKFVHKYMKSSSILLEGDSLCAKIANFGMAHILGEIPADRPPSTLASGEISEIIEEEPVVRPRIVRSRSKKLTGTRGYMAPEYITMGVVSSKMDVYAFGIILLEILSGQEPVTLRPDAASNTVRKTTVLESVNTIFEDKEPKNRLRAWIDPLLKDSYPLQQAFKFATVAKSCLDPAPECRPEMRHVALELAKVKMASEKWEASMLASKNFMSRSIEAR